MIKDKNGGPSSSVAWYETLPSVKKLKKTGKNKEDPIKEIHHRIRNNLQVISSLLDLQAEKFQNKECIEIQRFLRYLRKAGTGYSQYLLSIKNFIKEKEPIN